MIITPVGARCRTCAGVRPLAMYEIKPAYLLRGIGAGLLSAVVSAFIFLIYLRPFIFFTSFLYGFIIAQAIEYATNRRRGPTIQIIGVTSVLIGAFAALFLAGWLRGGNQVVTGLAFVLAPFRGDIFFFIFLIFASVVVWNRLS